MPPATVFTTDIYKRYFKPKLSEKKNLQVLKLGTVVFGLLGIATGIAMIGAKSLLDIWWELSGIFAGGMLGLFLLGIISRNTKNHEALTATCLYHRSAIHICGVPAVSFPYIPDCRQF